MRSLVSRFDGRIIGQISLEKFHYLRGLIYFLNWYVLGEQYTNSSSRLLLARAFGFFLKKIYAS